MIVILNYFLSNFSAYCKVYRFLVAGPLLIAVLFIELIEAIRKIKIYLLIVSMSASECDKAN